MSRARLIQSTKSLYLFGRQNFSLKQWKRWNLWDGISCLEPVPVKKYHSKSCRMFHEARFWSVLLFTPLGSTSWGSKHGSNKTDYKHIVNTNLCFEQCTRSLVNFENLFVKRNLYKNWRSSGKANSFASKLPAYWLCREQLEKWKIFWLLEPFVATQIFGVQWMMFPVV